MKFLWTFVLFCYANALHHVGVTHFITQIERQVPGKQYKSDACESNLVLNKLEKVDILSGSSRPTPNNSMAEYKQHETLEA